MKTKSGTFSSNKLTDAINNSMSIKIDDKSHNVAGINKRSNM
jgi:hypothetical protein